MTFPNILPSSDELGSRATLIGPLLASRSNLLRYGAAFVVVAATVAVRIALVPVVGQHSPLLIFLPALLLAAYLGGLGPALVACALSIGAATWFFTRWPEGTHYLAWGTHVGLFAVLGVLMSLITHRMQLELARRQRSESELRNTLQLLTHREQRLELATSVAELGIFVWDIASNRIVSETPRNYEIFGRNTADPPLTYEAFLERFVYPDDRAHFHEQVQSALTSNTPLRVVCRIVRQSDAGIRWLEIAGRTELSSSGLPLRTVGILRDITEAKRAEEALRESAHRLRLITDHLPVLISYIDREGYYQFSNAQYEDWLDAPPQPGQHMRDILGEETYRARRPQLETVLRGQVARFEGSNVHRRLGPRDCELTYVPDQDETGFVRGFYVMAQDVTERKQVETALRDADRRKDEFLAMLAHELRNPLAPIRTIAHVLSRHDVDADTVRRNSELLQRQAAQLARLVDDLLDVARITRGTIELKKQVLPLTSVIDQAIETVQPLLTLKHQTVSVTPAPFPMFVEGDEVRLIQVFANLLKNAAKYSPERTLIEVAMEHEDYDAVVRVRDPGIGIDPQLLPHIFAVFMQADRSLDRTEGGLGVGLTIVKHLAELHGGEVAAHSEGTGRGSTFTVKLPLAVAPLKSASALQEKAARPSRRVLVVDDNHDAAASLALLLSANGHEAEVVHDGPAALAKLETFPAEFVLLDIGLPGMDGYVVAQCMRERFRDAPLRIYAVTGYGRAEDRELAASSGCDGHLTKPVDPDDLLALLATRSLVEEK